MKAQMKSAQKPSHEGDQEPDFQTTHGSETPTKPQSTSRGARTAPDPMLLPDDVLAAYSNVGPSTPQVSPERPKPKNKLVLLDIASKPPKDMICGSRKIRVLQSDHPILPPKASAPSKSVREAWLTGQRGIMSRSQVPRHKPNSDFVRR